MSANSPPSPHSDPVVAAGRVQCLEARQSEGTEKAPIPRCTTRIAAAAVVDMAWNFRLVGADYIRNGAFFGLMVIVCPALCYRCRGELHFTSAAPETNFQLNF